VILNYRTSNGIRIRCPNTVCRLEERKHPAEKPAIEFVNDTFNPIGRLEKQIAEIEKKVDVMLLKDNDNNNHDLQPVYRHASRNNHMRHCHDKKGVVLP